LKKFVEKQCFYILVIPKQENSKSSKDDDNKERSKGSEGVGELEEVGTNDLLETQFK
jgi:hypothetical protein